MPKDLSSWLSKEQAAEALGVSTKIVEKLANEKTLQKEMKRRAGKPAIAVYHPDDVDRERKKRNPEAEAFVVPSESRERESASTELARHTHPPAAAEAFMGLLESLRRPSESLRITERHYLTLKQASDLSGLSQALLMRKIKAQELPAIKDVSWKIKRTDLEKLHLHSPPDSWYASSASPHQDASAFNGF